MRMLLCASIFAADDDASKKALQQLQGSWLVVAAEQDGKPAEAVKGHVITIDGKNFTIKAKDKVVYQGTISVDATKKPATIDWVHTGGNLKGKTWLGVYEVDGKKFTDCDNAPDLDKPRPTDLTAKAGSGRILVAMEKVEKK